MSPVWLLPKLSAEVKSGELRVRRYIELPRRRDNSIALRCCLTTYIKVVLVTASKDAAYLVVAQANDDLPAYNVDRLKACAIRSRNTSVEHRANAN